MEEEKDTEIEREADTVIERTTGKKDRHKN